MADVLLYIGYDENNLGIAKNVAVKVVDGSFLMGTPTSRGIDRSGVAGTTSSSLMGVNTSRRRFYIKNDSAINIWINPSVSAAATPGGGNIKIAANGGYFEFGFSDGAWSVIAESVGAAFTAREF